MNEIGWINFRKSDSLFLSLWWATWPQRQSSFVIGTKARVRGGEFDRIPFRVRLLTDNGRQIVSV